MQAAFHDDPQQLPAGRATDELFAVTILRMHRSESPAGAARWATWDGVALPEGLPAYSSDDALFAQMARAEQWPIVIERAGDGYIARHRADGSELARAPGLALAGCRALLLLAARGESP